MSSDEEFNFDSEDGSEEFAFESEDDAVSMGGGDQINYENLYYEADDIRIKKPAESLALFEDLIELESSSEQKTYTLKALPHCVILNARLRQFEKALSPLRRLMKISSDKISVLSSIHEQIEFSAPQKTAAEQAPLIREILSTLKSLNAPLRTWTTSALRWARQLDKEDDTAILKSLLAEIRSALVSHQEEEAAKAAILEVVALELQLAARMGDARAVRRGYQEALGRPLGQTSTAQTAVAFVADPAAVASVRAAGGRLLLSEGRYAAAAVELEDAFMLYEGAGQSSLARSALRLLVLCSILRLSDLKAGEVFVSPLQSEQALSHRSDETVNALGQLEDCVQRRDMAGANRLIKKYPAVFEQDPSIAPHLAAIRRQLFSHALEAQLPAVKRAKITRLAERIGAPRTVTVELLIGINTRGCPSIPAGGLEIREAQDEVNVLKLTSKQPNETPGMLEGLRKAREGSQREFDALGLRAKLEWATGIRKSFQDLPSRINHHVAAAVKAEVKKTSSRSRHRHAGLPPAFLMQQGGLGGTVASMLGWGAHGEEEDMQDELERLDIQDVKDEDMSM